MTDLQPPDNFLRIGPESEIEPGGVREIRFLGRTIRVERDPDGAFSAIDLVCRHQNMSLAGGAVEHTAAGDIVTCPAHGWRYNLATGDCLNEPWARLRSREVRVHDGQLYLAIQPTPDDAPTGEAPAPF